MKSNIDFHTVEKQKTDFLKENSLEYLNTWMKVDKHFTEKLCF